MLYIFDCLFLVEDPAEIVVVGGTDGDFSVPTCLAKAGLVSKTELDSNNTGAADK